MRACWANVFAPPILSFLVWHAQHFCHWIYFSFDQRSFGISWDTTRHLIPKWYLTKGHSMALRDGKSFPKWESLTVKRQFLLTGAHPIWIWAEGRLVASQSQVFCKNHFEKKKKMVAITWGFARYVLLGWLDLCCIPEMTAGLKAEWIQRIHPFINLDSWAPIWVNPFLGEMTLFSLSNDNHTVQKKKITPCMALMELENGPQNPGAHHAGDIPTNVIRTNGV